MIQAQQISTTQAGAYTCASIDKYIQNLCPYFLNSFSCCLLNLSYGVPGKCSGFRTGILLEPVAVDLFMDVSTNEYSCAIG